MFPALLRCHHDIACHQLWYQPQFAFGAVAQDVDGFEFALSLIVPVGPAVARGFALHFGADAVDRALVAWY